MKTLFTTFFGKTISTLEQLFWRLFRPLPLTIEQKFAENIFDIGTYVGGSGEAGWHKGAWGF